MTGSRLAVIVVVCSLNPLFSQTASGQQLTITPTSGPGGMSIAATSSGFDQFAVGYNTGFSVDGGPRAACPAAARANCTVQFGLSAYAVGEHTVTANNSARESASQTFTVLPPRLEIDPTCGPPGTMVTATGSNFGVDIAAGIYFDDGYINVFEYPDASGSIEITFPIPPSSDGVHTVAVRNSVGTNESRHFTTGAECAVIGVIVEADGIVEVQGADGTWTRVDVGYHLRQNQVVKTSADGRVGVLFADNTDMHWAGASEIKLNEYIYDPNVSPTKGSTFFTLLQGAFVYVSGLIGKDDLLDNKEVETPVGQLGIRGTEFIARHGAGAASVEVYLIENKVAITPNRTATTTEFTAPVTIVFDDSHTQTSPLTREDYDALKELLFSSPVSNGAPVCTAAVASASELSATSTRSMSRAISILGVTDPDGDSTAVTIDSIFQDEPVSDVPRFSPDASGIGTPMASLRLERSGTSQAPGDGRVYYIGFTARDGSGASCTGEVTVGIRFNANNPAVGNGKLFDSTKP